MENSDSALSLVALLSCPGIGQITLSKLKTVLLDRHLSWQQFWEGGAVLWRELSLTQLHCESIQKLVKEHSFVEISKRLEEKEIRVITKESSEYPPLLLQTEQAPEILFARGAVLNWKDTTPVAVVGTRHMTAYGRMVTEKITSELVHAGCSIVSGFMYGVDTCAHLSALKHHGQTVGVLGYGFEYVYPKSHTIVFEECLQQGMSFISPFYPDVQPSKGNFPARNAVVAGISAAVVVTEASLKSGTHITAGIAADLGRSVCAVPGPINSPYSEGTKWLVNQGATLVSSGQEVRGTLSSELIYTSQNKFDIANENALQNKIITYLLQVGTSDEEGIAQALKIDISLLLIELTNLELAGSLRKIGNLWTVV